jgi:hypothetical protein
MTEVLKVVLNICVELIELNRLFHHCISPSSLIIVISGYKTPRDVILIHYLEKLDEVMLPKEGFIIRLIVHLS